MERKRIIKNGHIVVKNPLYQELPNREVIIKSGRKVYKKRLIKRTGADKMSTYNPVWQTARRRKEKTYVKAV